VRSNVDCRHPENPICEPTVSRTHPHPPISFETHSQNEYSLSWDSVGSWIALGSYDKTIKKLRTLEGHSGHVRCLDWRKKLVSGSRDKTIKLWDGLSGQLLNTLTGHSSTVLSVAWSHDDSRIVSGSYDDMIKIWDGISGETIKTMTGHSSAVRIVSWNHDDSRIVSGSHDKTIKIWNSSSGTIIRTLEGLSNAVWSVSYSFGGTRIVSRSFDQTVRI
jgi:WD40 repeat protein